MNSWVLLFSQTFKNGIKKGLSIEENPVKSEANMLPKTFQKFDYFLIDFGRQNDRPEAPKMEPESIQKAPKNLSKNKTEKVGSSGAESGRRGGAGGPAKYTKAGVPLVDIK